MSVRFRTTDSFYRETLVSSPEPPARGGRRDRNQARQPQFPGNGDRGVPLARRYAREGRGDGEPCFDAHDAVLRSPARRAQPRRGRADCDLADLRGRGREFPLFPVWKAGGRRGLGSGHTNLHLALPPKPTPRVWQPKEERFLNRNTSDQTPPSLLAAVAARGMPWLPVRPSVRKGG